MKDPDEVYFRLHVYENVIIGVGEPIRSCLKGPDLGASLMIPRGH